MSTPRVTSVGLRNYRSIGAANVSLGPMTLLVGRNGAGKSNFLEALRLVALALQSNLDHAIRQLGGIGEVRRRSGGRPSNFSISLHVQLVGARSAGYAFTVGATKDGGFKVQREEASIAIDGAHDARFEVSDGALVERSTHLSLSPQILTDRLFLTSASAVPEFRELFDVLSRMHFYSVNPSDMRLPQPHEAGDVLLRSGRNIASLMLRLETDDATAHERIQDYMRQVVPGLDRIEHKSLGPTETLEFRQQVQTNKKPWRFYASSMSDGTLHALGVLAALFHTNPQRQAPTLVAIEEPERTIYPGAAGTLMDALMEAARRHQVIATTHSPDLLDNSRLPIESIRVVESVDGETIIEEVDEAAREAVRKELFTPGELLRKDQIAPEVRGRGQGQSPDLFKLG